MARFEFGFSTGVVRFVHFFNYPEGVSIGDGEKWYFDEHVSAARALPGIVRYRTWYGLPPIPMGAPDPYDRFVRMSELVFENMALCQQATIKNASLWISASRGKLGFGEFECVFLDEEPQFDLTKDIPVQQYKYIGFPARYAGGEPVYEDNDDEIMDVYMFNYRVSVVDGEDWYLGHHVREGKISKQVGLKHYQTWKTLRIPEESGNPLKPNRFYRITELGLPGSARVWPKEGDPPKPRIIFTMLPIGNVLGDWRNIVIDPKQVEDLLK